MYKRQDLYTNFETGVYWAAKELETIPSDVNLFTVSRDYYADDEKLSALTELAGEFVDMAVDMDETGLSAQLGGVDLATAFARIAGEMNVAVPAGSAVVDYMGKTQTDKGEVVNYNFDLVKDAPITLRVGSNTYTGTLGSGNTAVSYTHLDVYKRQPRRTLSAPCSCCWKTTTPCRSMCSRT